MTTSKEGFPLKAEGGEDLLKGLKDLKVKLTENGQPTRSLNGRA